MERSGNDVFAIAMKTEPLAGKHQIAREIALETGIVMMLKVMLLTIKRIGAHLSGALDYED
eukprot:4586105-Amphidinium_carterae.1